ncbi:dihydrofolate reductase family protein [Kocuria sp.]|uniref:dihydrofolate reductase family protein n=1 Tax=Kocuria sp. TaxID=1871328 RepID=UPI0028110AAD|nr:dihydrofolate reductase family protein [Kocuria sp.]
MSRTQYYVAASADGYIADRENHLDWLLQYGFEAYQDHYDGFLADVGALAMGASTYEFVLRQGEKWPYGGLPTWVFTHRELPRIAGADLRFVQGPVALHAEASRESAGGRNLWVVGGGRLAAQFADAGLLDELWLTLMPIALGGGHPVLPTAAAKDLRLQRTTHFEGGAVELRYALSPGREAWPE